LNTENLQTTIDIALSDITEELKSALQGVLTEIGAVSKDGLKEAVKVCKAIASVGYKLAKGTIKSEAAQHAVELYFESLRLIEYKIETEAKKLAYKSAVDLLWRIKDILLSAIQLGLSLTGYGQFGPLLVGLVDTFLNPNMPEKI
jgi:hypothetical protein